MAVFATQEFTLRGPGYVITQDGDWIAVGIRVFEGNCAARAGAAGESLWGFQLKASPPPPTKTYSIHTDCFGCLSLLQC